MCGFVGVLSARRVGEEDVRPMVEAIRLRGPDAEGVWVDSNAGIGLGHARLSVVDLSTAGHQPMCSPSGRFVIAFNGEIYNHLDLRSRLIREGVAPSWRGHADTETLLVGFDRWGVHDTVKRAIGMFAFAVWDRSTSELTLVRDRLGEKPLYYGWQDGAFLFGSVLKGLRVHPRCRREICRDAIVLLMRHGYIGSPHSIYEGIYKLQPGMIATVSLAKREVRRTAYWRAAEAIATGAHQPFDGTPEEAVSDLHARLREVVAGQLMSDVPIGAFLSGGIDSSTVVSVMQDVSESRVRTFTIGFAEGEYNEAKHAAAIAKHLGTNHTELYVSARDAQDAIPLLPTLYCEPFADSSQIPTFLVSRLARASVTVSLSGDGGDELFGGYNRYAFGKRLWTNMSRVPQSLRRALSVVIGSQSSGRWERLLVPIQRALPRRFAQAHVGERVTKLGHALGATSAWGLYEVFVSHWAEADSIVIGGSAPGRAIEQFHELGGTDAFVNQMMAVDLVTYLPDDILAKLDRAAMGVSLETRVPLLDHRLVEFAWRLPLGFKIRNGVPKWPLRQILRKYVPDQLVERPKVGFAVPIGAWLRGPLRDWAESLLDERRLRLDGYFQPEAVRAKWTEHLSGKRDWQYHLWDVLMFQAWLAENS